MKTNKKGISLIVLAITIIVMIILATAIILSVSGKNIIGSAKEATAVNDIANAKHTVAVAIAEWELEKVEGYDSVKKYAEAKLIEAGFTISGNGGFNVSSKGAVSTIYIDEDGKKALIPYGYVASEVTGEDKVATGLVIYEGTEAVTDKNVEDAKEERNQYVWVPVEDISTFKRVDWGSGTAITELTSYDTNNAIEAIEYAEMYESVKENKGFYIARYEAGKEGTDTLVSKWNPSYWTASAHWRNINWSDAKSKCETLSSDSAVSHLLYGEEWDATLQFISKTDEKYPTSIDYEGPYDSVNNIYHMKSDCYEWTMESGNTGRVLRGDSSAAYRRYVSEESVSSTYGFRSALYLK